MAPGQVHAVRVVRPHGQRVVVGDELPCLSCMRGVEQTGLEGVYAGYETGVAYGRTRPVPKAHCFREPMRREVGVVVGHVLLHRLEDAERDRAAGRGTDRVEADAAEGGVPDGPADDLVGGEVGGGEGPVVLLDVLDHGGGCKGELDGQFSGGFGQNRRN